MVLPILEIVSYQLMGISVVTYLLRRDLGQVHHARSKAA